MIRSRKGGNASKDNEERELHHRNQTKHNIVVESYWTIRKYHKLGNGDESKEYIPRSELR